MINRKKFLQQTTMSFVAATALPFICKAAILTTQSAAKKQPLKLGMAGFTFLNFDLPASIKMMQRVNVKNLSIKEFHLPLDSSPQKIMEVLQQLSNAGITPYAVGVIYMKTKDEVDRAFQYAKAVGVNLLVGVPAYDLIDYTEQKVKEHNIRIAIHNHGPQDKLYPSPKNVYDHISKKDKRMGLCIDIGHTQRTGLSPADAVLQYQDRLFDLHIKDVTAPNNDGKAIEVGRGIIDFVAFEKALYKINYSGMCSFEYELDMKDPLPGIAESVGYFKGVQAGV